VDPAPPDPRRALPAVDAVLRGPGLAELLAAHPRGLVADRVREALARRRAAGEGADGLEEEVAAALRPSLRRVINGTGVALSTNLGRAPLAEEAVAAAIAAAGYSTLEWDAATGDRGDRDVHLRDHLRALTGAEDAIAVNTNAGAVLLALVATCAPGEALVSRGQLVEIGGGFRVPEILAASGCRLVEVGTTNRTRLADYAAAAGADTRAILRVHPSNFRQLGFTEEAPLEGLVGLARERGLRVIDDLGSGALAPGALHGDEPDARGSVAAGSDVACFSADKLLGGPQAGILVGRAGAIAAARRHPLYRALRLDKLRIAALEATLALHRDPGAARRRIPALAMLADDAGVRMARARALAAAIGAGAEAVPTVGRVGGGALPLAELPSAAVAFDRTHPAKPFLADRLRALDPPVATRVHQGRVLIDVLALSERDLAELPDLIRAALTIP
jgi:L-seryl-tRNA(Ser) seleniumtransferase